MLSALATIVAALALVLNGLMAGIFFAFSNSITPGLGAIDPAQAVTAMRSINQKILNPAFLAVFVLSPFASAAAGVLLLLLGETAAAIWFFAAGAVYALGAFLPTAALNVPMNNALEAGELDWQGYGHRWTRWNTVRAAANVIALLLIGAGLWVWQ
ncbi:anthrone oxygenase family protein [Nonomuraea sp. LPB2021202275-12-8]|uniref:anthrone oxygenase family protein n=1 Tax=Nonomuraea sp. LPB2021202275-12-8 TaxID=3120159 RepID=UPI00300D57F3